MTADPIAQHFVPKSYLKQFTNTKGQLFTLNSRLLNEGRKVVPSNAKTPAQIGYGKNFYTLNPKTVNVLGKRIDTQLRPMFLEIDVFSKYENDISILIKKMIVLGYLNRPDAIRFARILIDLKFRNKFLRGYIEKKSPALIDQTLKDVKRGWIKRLKKAKISKRELRAIKKNMSTAGKKYAQEEGLSQKLHNDFLVNKALSGNPVRDQQAEILLSYQWSIYTAGGTQKFITSDNPGYTIDIANGTIQHSKLEEDFVMYFPLDPDHCLCITDKLFDQNGDSKLKHLIPLRIAPERIRLLNQYACERATEFVIADSKLQLENFLDDYKKRIVS